MKQHYHLKKICERIKENLIAHDCFLMNDYHNESGISLWIDEHFWSA